MIKSRTEQMREYGDADTNPKDYEEDHLIPLEIGGNPTDPIEIILIDQISMAHLITGYLYVNGLNAASVECAGAYLGAGARLTGELRRTALALQDARVPPRKTSRRRRR